MRLQPIHLNSCPKNYTKDLDKALSPEQTIKAAQDRLASVDLDILAECRRVDVSRLGIPVYMSICGLDARAIMPTRKQMGKGSSKAQAQASAIMELVERYSFFRFWESPPGATRGSWSEISAAFGPQVLPIEEMLLSVNDSIDASTALQILNARQWIFYPATRLDTGQIVWIPLDWFRALGEFNGASAGNTPEESLLQGISELIERHVCNLADQTRPVLPTIDLDSCNDQTLASLISAFRKNGLQIVLKDFSLGMPAPTVGAIAWDPATFPDKSEIVFTAGTASSPLKAAIRAITEVAQLGGDFCTNSCYEASGLPKFENLADAAWLFQGPEVALADLPDLSNPDILIELRRTLAGLSPIHVYGVDMTDPKLGMPAHYSVAPGLGFRERDRNQSLALFTGRLLTEKDNLPEAEKGLKTLASLFPDAHWLPFFRGMLALRKNDFSGGSAFFGKAIGLQPDAESRALASFYQGYAHTLENDWHAAIAPLADAVSLSPQAKEYLNLLGVALFRNQRYEEAEECFNKVLKIDKGSAMDLANRGLCREALGQAQEARADLEAALELDPTLDFARVRLDRLQER